MDLKEIMQFNHFVVVGDTINPDKYAYKIKQELIKNNYKVESIGKELKSINEVTFDIECLDLCIHPAKGIQLLKENKKDIKAVVIQPGAESEEIINYLKDNNINYIEGCLLVGLRLYKKA